jgi:hypothetical protein
MQPLLVELGETLAAHGGTVGILRKQAPARQARSASGHRYQTRHRLPHC